MCMCVRVCWCACVGVLVCWCASVSVNVCASVLVHVAWHVRMCRCMWHDLCASVGACGLVRALVLMHMAFYPLPCAPFKSPGYTDLVG
jgi:hypothetical protein